ncbi:MAG: hypothetical protein ACRCUY_11350 [Thermoguttaceae bacterium]
MLEQIKHQTLLLITELTEHPKPSYSIDGQTVSWTDYLSQLQKTVEWCDRMLERDQIPTEILSTGI